MYGSAIPRVMSKHPGPQPSPEMHGVNCTQKKAWRPLDGDLESSGFMIKGGPGGGSLDGQIPRCYEEGAQAVCLELFTQKCVNTWTWNLEWGGETTRLQLD